MRVIVVFFGGLLICSCSGSSCPEGERRCNGTCTAVQSDPDNCGACGVVCSAEQVCDRGQCTDSCSSGLTNCSRRCVDLGSDPKHCGGCDNSCEPGQTCQQGSCIDSVPKDGGVSDGATPDAAPCTSRLVVHASGAYNADLKVIQISGTVTVNGKQMPDATNSRGHLEFRDQNGHSSEMPGFKSSGPGTYSGILFAGTYDVYYRHSSYCDHGEPIPCQDHLAKKGLALKASGNLNLDLKVVQVSGTVTVNGKPMPDATNSRGHLELRDQDGHPREMPSFKSSGAGTYSGGLFAGTYDVLYRHSSYCDHGEPIPCQDHLAKKGLALKASGNLNLDLKVVQLSGQVTVNGKAMPGSANSRGYLELRDQDSFSREMPGFGTSGPGTYSGNLFAGEYDVVYRHSSYCDHGEPIPCQDNLIKGCGQAD